MEGTDIPALVVSGASLFASVLALWIASVAIGRSDKNASAATMVTLYEGFREGWRRFLKADEEGDRYFEMAELMNTFEIACGIHQEGSIHGVSRELLEEYLCNTLSDIAANSDAQRQVHAMVEAATTFKYVARFQTEMQRCGRFGAEPLILRRQA